MKILIIGAGRLGLAVAAQLTTSNEFVFEIADVTTEAEDRARRHGYRMRHLDGSKLQDCIEVFANFDLVVNAAPHYLAPVIAGAALEAGIHYVDSVEDSSAIKALITDHAPRSIFLPGCGLSPGLVANIAAELTGALEGPIDIVVRAGGLPVNPSTGFGYGFSWDVDGMIAEYTGRCEAIVDGEIVSLAPLQQHENFVLDGQPYEAFSTAGGLGDLCIALKPKVRNLSFKTIRYPGHLLLARFLFEELGLKRRRDMLRTVLRYGVPDIVQDVLLIFISVRGQSEGVPAERSYVRKIYHPPMRGDQPTSAMSLASAAHVCAMLDLIRDGVVHGNGLKRHETIPFEAIRGNRFLVGCLI